MAKISLKTAIASKLNEKGYSETTVIDALNIIEAQEGSIKDAPRKLIKFFGCSNIWQKFEQDVKNHQYRSSIRKELAENILSFGMKSEKAFIKDWYLYYLEKHLNFPDQIPALFICCMTEQKARQFQNIIKKDKFQSKMFTYKSQLEHSSIFKESDAFLIVKTLEKAKQTIYNLKYKMSNDTTTITRDLLEYWNKNFNNKDNDNDDNDNISKITILIAKESQNNCHARLIHVGRQRIITHKMLDCENALPYANLQELNEKCSLGINIKWPENAQSGTQNIFKPQKNKNAIEPKAKLNPKANPFGKGLETIPEVAPTNVDQVNVQVEKETNCAGRPRPRPKQQCPNSTSQNHNDYLISDPGKIIAQFSSNNHRPNCGISQQQYLGNEYGLTNNQIEKPTNNTNFCGVHVNDYNSSPNYSVECALRETRNNNYQNVGNFQDVTITKHHQTFKQLTPSHHRNNKNGCYDNDDNNSKANSHKKSSESRNRKNTAKTKKHIGYISGDLKSFVNNFWEQFRGIPKWILFADEKCPPLIPLIAKVPDEFGMTGSSKESKTYLKLFHQNTVITYLKLFHQKFGEQWVLKEIAKEEEKSEECNYLKYNMTEYNHRYPFESKDCKFKCFGKTDDDDEHIDSIKEQIRKQLENPTILAFFPYITYSHLEYGFIVQLDRTKMLVLTNLKNKKYFIDEVNSKVSVVQFFRRSFKFLALSEKVIFCGNMIQFEINKEFIQTFYVSDKWNQVLKTQIYSSLEIKLKASLSKDEVFTWVASIYSDDAKKPAPKKAATGSAKKAAGKDAAKKPVKSSDGDNNLVNKVDAKGISNGNLTYFYWYERCRSLVDTIVGDRVPDYIIALSSVYWEVFKKDGSNVDFDLYSKLK